jgi:DNA-binding response OmpR family regulator
LQVGRSVDLRVSEPRILIVDDDPSIRGLLRVIAQRAGVLADEARDGAHCLELLHTRVYDLIVLDLAMPRLNGFDVVEHLRRQRTRPAVIALTALGSSAFVDLDPEVVHCILRKPFEVDLLTSLIVTTAAGIHDARRPRPSNYRDDKPEARPQ